MSSGPLVEHFFRHEYGRLVAVLSRRVGVQHLEAVEDAVQAALLTALEAWTVGGLPDNPSAWLFRVAHNGLVGELRQRGRRTRLLAEQGTADVEPPSDGPEPFLAGEVQDDLLRMLFLCCDDQLPQESQLALALKTLCGFDVREISLRLFTSEANVYKRLERARNRLQELPPFPDELAEGQHAARLPAVHRILYLPRWDRVVMTAKHETARIEAFSDGGVASAATLLILEIKVPDAHEIHSAAELQRAHVQLWPSYFAFVYSFGTIFVAWINHHRSFEMIARRTRPLLRANGFVLLTVTFLPFPTALLAQFLTTQHAQPAITFFCASAAFHNLGWIVFVEAMLRSREPQERAAHRAGRRCAALLG